MSEKLISSLCGLAASLLGGLLLVLTLGWTASPPDRQAKPAAQRATVVILHSLHPELPGVQELSAAVRSTLETGAKGPVDVYSEYTGLDRFSGPEYQRSLLTLYQEKYARKKVDLLVVVGPAALEFVVSKHFLEGVPVVTSYVAQRYLDAARAQRPELTGALPALNAPRTIELMLSLYPKTRRIHVVLGASEHERAQAEAGRHLFKSFAKRVELQYLNDLSLEQMEQRLARLGDDELVLFGSLLQDAAGRDYNTNAALTRLSRASRRPLFGVVTEDLGHGITGGVLLSMELAGRSSAELALRILGGEKASSVPLVPDTGMASMFDWRELQRWGISANSLPAGSVFRFRKASLWDSHGREIALALGLFLLQSLLVAGLVVQLQRRRRTERKLAEAQARYRTVADFTLDWEFWLRPDGQLEYVSPACERVSGYPPQAFKERPQLLGELVLEEDRAAWEAFQADSLVSSEVCSLQYRLRTRAGEVRWVEQANNPVHLDGAPPAGSRGSVRDITDRKQAELSLKKAYEEIGALKDSLEAENTYYRKKIQSVEGSLALIGQSDPMKYLVYRVRQVAPSPTTVLIQGETGTGKELVAEEVHKLGPRKDRPLVKINCAALPPTLAESELFGHERGAFTGAQTQRKGRFELAHGATLFLDEVGELSLEVQAKLLRVLQSGEFQRVGGDHTLHVDVRVIAATNRDLAREVAAGRFREDLWYRLNVFPISVPPLRQRAEDIPMLTQAFVTRACQKLGKPPLDIPTSVIQALQAFRWPGNVRELQNVLERAVLVSEGSTLRLADALFAGPEVGTTTTAELRSLVEVEKDHILQVLEACDWKLEGRSGAAERLGLKPSTLRSRMSKLGIGRGRVGRETGTG
jgi:PAS domain S-box-containing protein